MILVTIKLPRNQFHNPHAKVIGPCPFSERCSDSTGEHHTTWVDTPEEVVALSEQYHITRVEHVEE